MCVGELGLGFNVPALARLLKVKPFAEFKAYGKSFGVAAAIYRDASTCESVDFIFHVDIFDETIYVKAIRVNVGSIESYMLAVDFAVANSIVYISFACSSHCAKIEIGIALANFEFAVNTDLHAHVTHVKTR